MTRAYGTRDGENEAFIVDRYLESLLSRRPVDLTDIPPELQATAAALTAGLPRYHPSFRFEDALAARLGAASTPGLGRADPERELIPFPAVVVATAPDGRPVAIRPAVIGGVLTSAAISLAGAAYVAWRRSRPADPMARAIRAAARRRTA